LLRTTEKEGGEGKGRKEDWAWAGKRGRASKHWLLSREKKKRKKKGECGLNFRKKKRKARRKPAPHAVQGQGERGKKEKRTALWVQKREGRAKCRQSPLACLLPPSKGEGERRFDAADGVDPPWGKRKKKKREGKRNGLAVS